MSWCSFPCKSQFCPLCPVLPTWVPFKSHGAFATWEPDGQIWAPLKTQFAHLGPSQDAQLGPNQFAQFFPTGSHLGPNNFASYVPKKSMFEGIKQILAVTRELLPHSIIYWSEILPKVSYPSANKQNSVERTRRALNRSVGNLFLRAPGGLIAHPQIAWWRQEFYLPDGVHLVDAASQFLIYNFHMALIRSCEVA